MSLLLSVSAIGMDDESIQELTRQLCNDLRHEAGIESGLAKEPVSSGAKSGGELEIIGQIVLKAVGTGGVIAAMINVFKVYMERRPSLQIKIQKKRGGAIEIKADDLRRSDMTELVNTIKKAFEDE